MASLAQLVGLIPAPVAAAWMRSKVVPEIRMWKLCTPNLPLDALDALDGLQSWLGRSAIFRGNLFNGWPQDFISFTRETPNRIQHVDFPHFKEFSGWNMTPGVSGWLIFDLDESWHGYISLLIGKRLRRALHSATHKQISAVDLWVDHAKC